MFLLNKLKLVNPSLRRFSSALYITGDKAQKNFVILQPVIDFDDQLKDKSKILRNLELRESSIDLSEVEERWMHFKDLKNRKNVLADTRSTLARTITDLKKLEGDEVAAELNKLIKHLEIIKEDLRNLKDILYEVEEGAALKVLNLPNILHPNTPSTTEQEVYKHLEKPSSQTNSNLQNQDQLVKIINHASCYLQGDAALFEQSIQNSFSYELPSFGYVQFSNADFVKSVVVEGCGKELSDVLTLENIHCSGSDELNKLHLTGASSMYSFMAYFARHFVHASQLPVKAFCTGRAYRVADETRPANLYNLNQSTEIGLFIATIDDAHLFERIIEEVVCLYKKLGLHFRIMLVPANQLNKAESLRLSIQMFSNSQGGYIEVGGISFYGDYLSKRLLLNYSEKGVRMYPKVIGGSLVNIHKVIGCLLETNSEDENRIVLKEFLSQYVY